ncbi:molybdate ABC transporter substrate-binding protein [Marinithermofilum abyssi]|uniref:molybdate ABC transporter substrate-binding protein n=1 Tax=Marinithermofilum abyssi TaxID=1571185 RepID=UPI0016680715|nr:molybdate ABC transporter substrate-binding protein [Marinithermofilum abyssi]
MARSGSGCIWAAIFLLLVGGCSLKGGERQEVHVLAAASLSQGMKQAERLYEAKHPDVDLVFSYGSSGQLQRQIEQGAPCDLFVSAGQKEMQALVRQGRIDPDDVEQWLRNDLVVVIPKDHKIDINSIRSLALLSGKVAVGQPETVPAGTYARQSLQHFGVWKQMQDRLIFGKDARQVLAYVETGNVQAGLVYLTDARSTSRVRIATHIPSNSHQPIIYPMGLIKNGDQSEQVRSFYRWLQGEQAKAIFLREGFKGAANH